MDINNYRFTLEQVLAIEAVKQLMPKLVTDKPVQDSKLIVLKYQQYLREITSELYPKK